MPWLANVDQAPRGTRRPPRQAVHPQEVHVRVDRVGEAVGVLVGPSLTAGERDAVIGEVRLQRPVRGQADQASVPPAGRGGGEVRASTRQHQGEPAHEEGVEQRVGLAHAGVGRGLGGKGRVLEEEVGVAGGAGVGVARGQDHVPRVEARPPRRLDREAARDHVQVRGDEGQAARAALEYQRSREQAGVLAERAGVAKRPAEQRIAGRRRDVGSCGPGAQRRALGGSGAGCRRQCNGEDGAECERGADRAIVTSA